MYTLPQRTKAYKAMKATIVAARAKVETPDADAEKEKGDATTEAKTETAASSGSSAFRVGFSRGGGARTRLRKGESGDYAEPDVLVHV